MLDGDEYVSRLKAWDDARGAVDRKLDELRTMHLRLGATALTGSRETDGAVVAELEPLDRAEQEAKRRFLDYALGRG